MFPSTFNLVSSVTFLVYLVSCFGTPLDHACFHYACVRILIPLFGVFLSCDTDGTKVCDCTSTVPPKPAVLQLLFIWRFSCISHEPVLVEVFPNLLYGGSEGAGTLGSNHQDLFWYRTIETYCLEVWIIMYSMWKPRLPVVVWCFQCLMFRIPKSEA